jgi:hypothetical protein
MNDPRNEEYEARHRCRLAGPLGPGVGQDGFVLRTGRLTAVKFFDRADRFQRELEVYQVLRAKGINEIAGHRVPQLIDVDEELRAIEISIVERPFLLDFAGAKRPEEVPDFEQHVIDEHLARLQELFEDRWADVLHVAEMFRRQTGFVLLDIHPGNIAFASESAEK